MFRNKVQITKFYKSEADAGFSHPAGDTNGTGEIITEFIGDDGKRYANPRALARANAKYQERMNPHKEEEIILKNEPIKENYTPNNLKD